MEPSRTKIAKKGSLLPSTSTQDTSFPNIEDIEVIVLDLGGVIIDIDPERSSRAFSRLGSGSLLEEHSKAEQDRLYDRLERGEIDAATFRQELRSRGGIEASDRAIDEAWNALLLDIPLERFRFLEELRKRYELHLFSNTNELHMEGFERIVEARYGMKAFEELFHGIHLSYRLRARKPEKEAFELLIKEVGAEPHRILFIDDTRPHVDSARELGICAYHLGKDELTALKERLL